MRTMQSVFVSLGLVALAGICSLAGCSFDAEDCALNATCNRDGTPFDNDVVEPPAGCTDSPSSNPDVIRDECAFFVGGPSASDMNPGTQAAPLNSLQAAVDGAKTSKARVYLCGVSTEHIEIAAGVSIFGGFDCTMTQWKYDATMRATIAPPAPTSPDDPQVAVRISGIGTTSIEDVNIQAASTQFEGDSSIAVIVDKAVVHFARANLTAGDGHSGVPGTTPTDDVGPSDPSSPFIMGNDGITACENAMMDNPGGAPRVNPLCGESSGGSGGTGTEMSGQSGGLGLPLGGASGLPGAGESAMTACTMGGPGAAGKTGPNGSGAMGLGTIDAAKGYVGTNGDPGLKGTVGQGGGGGGGAKGKLGCGGASGGSGGAGGCPGNGGSGGGPGGSSIGIIAMGASLHWLDVTITTGSGGAGGDGGPGQKGGGGGIGGVGGIAASMTKAACNGGNGGNGGQGGSGGGGHGGHSLGIAYSGSVMLILDGVMVMTGSAGNGGAGADAASIGESGVKADTQPFP